MFIFGHLGPNICIFGPFGHMRMRCLGEVSVMWVPELLLPPIKNMIFGPKTAKFGSKYAFFGTYRPYLLIWCPIGGCLVFVVRGLYLAKRLFTLFIIQKILHLMRGEL